jgi:hypothetical protein
MDSTTELLVLGILASIIMFFVELIKAWVPAKNKDSDGVIIFYAKGKKHIHIPNAALWPTISLLIGMILFIMLKLNVFNPVLPSAHATEALSGASAALGSNGAYRVKSATGNLLGGSTAQNAQNTGVATATSVVDPEVARMITALKGSGAVTTTTAAATPTTSETTTMTVDDNNFF